MKFKKIKKYIPNTLTISRIILTPIIMATFISNNLLLTLILTIYSLTTDFLDGFLSRKWNVTSKLGALLDQIADKVLGISALIISIKYVPILFLNLIFECVISSINIISKLKGNNPKSLFSGKVKTWSLSFTIVSSIATKFIPELTILSTLLSIITSTLQIKTTNDYYKDYKKGELFRNRNKKENCNNDKLLHHSQKDKQPIYSKQEQINYLTNLKHNLLHEKTIKQETIKPKTMVKK